MYVVHPAEFDRIACLKGPRFRAKWIKGDPVYAPKLIALSNEVSTALTREFPEVKGLGDSKIILRRSEPGA
jgi:hypothetical protein